MNIFKSEISLNTIVSVVFVPYGCGRPLHKDRPTHGFAFNVGCDVTYHFETGETLVCHADELIYLPKGANYTAKFDNEQSNVNTGVYAVNFLLNNNEAFSPKTIQVKAKTTLHAAFSKMNVAWRKKDVAYRDDCFSLFYKILKTIKTDLANYAPMQKLRDVLAPALRFIDERHTTEQITSAQLASLCNVSEPYLRKLFHNLFGVSPIVYIRNLKIEYAKELLLSAEYSVTEIAMITGFNDAAYFSREFKKATGITPNGYATLFKAKQ